MNKFGFFLMNRKGFEVLTSLPTLISTDSFFVVSNMDKGMIDDYFDQIKSFCNKNIIAFYSSDQKLPKAEYKFAIGWRWMIKESNSLIILHDSLLPKYRGFAPLVNALINGESEIGVTALFASDNYDCGDIILQQKIKIDYPIKIDDAIKRIIPLYISIIQKIINIIMSGQQLKGTPQKDSLASYSLWRDEKDYFIDWNIDASKIQRMIDSLGFPYQGARTTVNNVSIIIEDCEVIKDVVIENRQPGKVIFLINNCPLVVCKSGLLKINVMKDINGKPFKLKKFRSRFV